MNSTLKARIEICSARQLAAYLATPQHSAADLLVAIRAQHYYDHADELSLASKRTLRRQFRVSAGQASLNMLRMLADRFKVIEFREGDIFDDDEKEGYYKGDAHIRVHYTHRPFRFTVLEPKRKL